MTLLQGLKYYEIFTAFLAVINKYFFNQSYELLIDKRRLIVRRDNEKGGCYQLAHLDNA